jgi:predicted ATPase
VLDRWHGPAYPDLDEIEEGRAEAARLEELRTRARELSAEARVSDGRAGDVIGELQTLVMEQPLRERPRSLLMSALAAVGRHAEALHVYDDFRRLLGEELGTEPSPLLASQHSELLAGTLGAEWSPRIRLSERVTSLIGRNDLLADITASVAPGRLVTLVGPGGVGKTRLLVEVGHTLVGDRPERPIVECELASADVDSAVDVVAAALGIDARPGTPLAERVAEIIGRTELVLLLDNCEHVLEPIAELVEQLLARCAAVCIIATSRERLRVPGEHVHVVPTLPAGGPSDPAVELFIERALAVAPGFEPDRNEIALILEIARGLDGLPLAIELAAARLHTHDLTEVAAGLNDRLSLLSAGYRSSSRHASLATAVAWSYGLLVDALQRAFVDLSIFSGPFDVADAAAVCAVDERAATRSLGMLVERSLVARTDDRRYVMLQTLRAYGAEQLAASDRAEVVGERHARHQVAWIKAADVRSAQPGELVFVEIDAAIPELRAALDWLLDHHATELARELVAGLWTYGFMRLRPDVLAWSERVIAADPDDGSPAAAIVWVAAAYAAWMAGDIAETRRRSDHALRLAQRTGDEVPSLIGMICGSSDLFEGRLHEAAEWYQRSAETAMLDNPAFSQMSLASAAMALGYAGDPQASALAERALEQTGHATTPHAAYVWYCAGEADLALGEVDRARHRLGRAVELAELTNASFVFGIAGASKASIDAKLGDPATVTADYRRLILHWRRAGMWSTQWTMLRSIAGLLHRLGHERDAAVLEGAVRATDAGHRIFGADAAALDELGAAVRDALGESAYDAARREGSALDGDAAIDVALRALRSSAPE